MTGAAVVTGLGTMGAVMGAGIGTWHWFSRRGRGISIVIPFRAPRNTGDARVRNLVWLERYWKAQLPGAEVIIGDDPDTDKPFSKAVAINRAVARSHGDILVLVDADGFLPAHDVLHCADEIRKARKRGHKLWFVPYRRFYRLTEEATQRILASDPRNPYTLPDPPDARDSMSDDPAVNKAHWYGALIQIVPREGFDAVGGWDERFRGWGGEDHAIMRATDTLYGLHKTLPGRVLHFWHPMIGSSGSTDSLVTWKERMWEGQEGPVANSRLSGRYYAAQFDPRAMRNLCNEWKSDEVMSGNSSAPDSLLHRQSA